MAAKVDHRAEPHLFVSSNLHQATRSPAQVLATATRPVTIAWMRQLGPELLLGRNLEQQLAQFGRTAVDVLFSTTHTVSFLPIIPQLWRPFGARGIHV